LYQEAVDPFENELKNHPENVSAKQLLGLSYFMTENYARAAALLSEVVAAKPNEPALSYPLALSLIKQGKIEAADGIIQQMLVRGDSPEIHILLGQAYYGKGDSAKALEELQKALALDSKTRLAHFYTGVIYLKMGKL